MAKLYLPMCLLHLVKETEWWLFHVRPLGLMRDERDGVCVYKRLCSNNGNSLSQHVCVLDYLQPV